MNMGRIYALSLRLMGGKRDAEHLTAKVFISAWKNIKSVRVDSLFSSWLMSLTVYNALEELRNSGEKRKKDYSPEELKDFEKINEKLERDIFSLPKDPRLVLVLNKIEKYTVEEVADLLQISKENTKEFCDEAANSLLTMLPEIQSTDQLFNKLGNLPKEYIPDRSVSENIYKVVYEKRLMEAEKKSAALEQDKTIEDLEREEQEKKEKEEKSKKEKEKRKKEEAQQQFINKKMKKSFDFSKLGKMLVPIVLALVVIGSVYYFFFYKKTGFDVLIEKGTAKIDNSMESGETFLSDGSSITTSNDSYALIKIPDVGTIEIGPLSSLKKLEKIKEVLLSSGSSDVNFLNATQKYSINIPSAQITDYNSTGYAYKVTIDELKNSNIHVKKGWITIQSSGREDIICEDYKIDIVNEFGAGVPYHISSSPEFVELINNVAIKNLETSVAAVVEASTTKEVLTLWNLLPRLRPVLREVVYNKLYQLLPHVEEISKEDLLNLNPEKLNLWLEEIKILVGK